MNLPNAQVPLDFNDWFSQSDDEPMTPTLKPKKARLSPPPMKNEDFNQVQMMNDYAKAARDMTPTKLFENEEEDDSIFDEVEFSYPILEKPQLIRQNAINFNDLVDRIETPVVIPQKRPRTEQKNGPGPKLTRWCITYNNPQITCEEMDEILQNEDVKGYVFQLEKASTGTQHFQMYIELKKGFYMTGIKKLLQNNTIHCEKTMGTKKQNITYCTKEEGRIEGPFIGGTCLNPEKSGEQGKRTDLENLTRRILDEGMITDEMIEENGALFAKYGKNLKWLNQTNVVNKKKKEEMEYWKEQAQLLKEGKPIQGQRQRYIELYFGPTGCGKTTMAKAKVADKNEPLYEKEGINKWWDGYEGEPNVLLDEFKGDSYGTIEQFNRMTNVGVYQGETKGGHALITADNIYLTTNRHPRHWWKKSGDKYTDWSDPRYQAVARRIAIVHWWDESMKHRELRNPNQGGDEKQWIAFWKWHKPEGYTIQNVGQGIFEQKIIKTSQGYFDAPDGWTEN